jgi:hypothetical protein
MLGRAGWLKDKLGEEIPHGAGHGNKHISYAEENEDYLHGEDDAGEHKEICEKEDDAGANALVALVKKEHSADVRKKPGH